jgi:hypothetical protein
MDGSVVDGAPAAPPVDGLVVVDVGAGDDVGPEAGALFDGVTVADVPGAAAGAGEDVELDAGAPAAVVLPADGVEEGCPLELELELAAGVFVTGGGGVGSDSA